MWKDPSAGMQQGAEALQSSESTSSTFDSDIQWPWDPQSRCYLADMHDTEVRPLTLYANLRAREHAFML